MRFLNLIRPVLLARNGALVANVDESAAEVDPPSAVDTSLVAVEIPADAPVEPRHIKTDPYSWSQADYRWPMDLCGESTFEGETDPEKSPLIADCELVIDKLSEATNQVVWAAAWNPDDENLGEFAAVCLKNDPADADCARFGQGSCTFGFRPDAYDGLINHKVGYTDIVDVMRDAIVRAGNGKRVGAGGAFDCVNDDSSRTSRGKIHWKIWNPDLQPAT